MKEVEEEKEREVKGKGKIKIQFHITISFMLNTYTIFSRIIIYLLSLGVAV
jgi:hypothetical protein